MANTPLGSHPRRSQPMGKDIGGGRRLAGCSILQWRGAAPSVLIRKLADECQRVSLARRSALAPDSENAARASKTWGIADGPAARERRTAAGSRPHQGNPRRGGKGWHRLAIANDMCKGVSAARAGGEQKPADGSAVRKKWLTLRSAATPDGHNPWEGYRGRTENSRSLRYCNGGPHQACFERWQTNVSGLGDAPERRISDIMLH